MLRGNQITNLTVQVPFEIAPKFKYRGKVIRAISYYADFVYTEKGKLIIEDCKGMKTQVYKLKKKLLLASLLLQGVEFDFIET